MSLWARSRSWTAALLRRTRMEREMDEEMRFHIEAHAADLVRHGLPQPEALRQARLEFGGMEMTKEECRDAVGVSFLETLIQDVRHGVRTLLRTPVFTVITVVVLALGIGGTTAIFSVVDAVLLRPLAYRDSGRLVTIPTSRFCYSTGKNATILPVATKTAPRSPTSQPTAAGSTGLSPPHVRGPEVLPHFPQLTRRLEAVRHGFGFTTIR